VALVNIFNPAASPLQRYTPTIGDPGTTTAGVDILMESNGVGIGPTNPLSNLVPMVNDDYNTRQFLYPQAIPEPSTNMMLGGALARACYYGRRRRRQLAVELGEFAGDI
jgi:hypothetical protein